MISLYISRQTWLHRIYAGPKLLFLALATVLIFPVQSAFILALGLAIVLLIYASLGKPGLKRLVGLKKILPIILGIGIFQALIASVDLALVSVGRILLMIMLADLVTITTPLQQMLSVLTPLLKPLRIFGLNSAKLALMVALVIRFIPLLASQWTAQSEAWRARSKKRPGLQLLVPFSRETLRLSDRVAEAVQARHGL